MPTTRCRWRIAPPGSRAQAQGYPVLVAEDAAGIAGFASFGDFRAWPGYRHTVEHSVAYPGGLPWPGTGRALVTGLFPLAEGLGKHVMIAGVDAENAASIALHERLGFDRVAHFREVGRKFDRWLDLVFLPARLGRRPGPKEFHADHSVPCIGVGCVSGAGPGERTGTPGHRCTSPSPTLRLPDRARCSGRSPAWRPGRPAGPGGLAGAVAGALRRLHSRSACTTCRRSRHAILRNYPMRRICASCSSTSGRRCASTSSRTRSRTPFSRQPRRGLPARQGRLDKRPFGTQLDVYARRLRMDQPFDARRAGADAHDFRVTHRRPRLRAAVRRERVQHLGDELRRAVGRTRSGR